MYIYTRMYFTRATKNPRLKPYTLEPTLRVFFQFGFWDLGI